MLQAHAAGDLDALWRLYRDAASDAELAGDEDRTAFFLTHAWIFALDFGATKEASELFEELKAMGRA